MRVSSSICCYGQLKINKPLGTFVGVNIVQMTDTFDIELSNIDSRLQAIDKERFELLERRKSLVEQSEAEFANNFNRYASEEAKVALFLSNFKGRNDVYPIRWTNQKGKSGYSPAFLTSGCRGSVIREISVVQNVPIKPSSRTMYKPYLIISMVFILLVFIR